MTEKRVSVRLSATGGRQVKAELEGVGEAGARGFGRLSREMEMANARLAAFARRTRVVAAAAIVAAATAMIRSGLQTVDAQAKLAALTPSRSCSGPCKPMEVWHDPLDHPHRSRAGS